MKKVTLLGERPDFMEFVDQVKQSLDIVAVVGEYVRLRKAGTRWVGLCPFHNEKTPSFGVNPVHQYYKCFGCGAGGDAIKFVMEIEGLTFWEALKLLAEKNGIPLPKRTEAADEDTRRRARLYEMHEIAMRHFEENLWGPAGAETRGYLERRAVARPTAQEFHLGLSDRGGQTLARILERAGFSHDEMEQAGLVQRRQDGSGVFDRFRGRLMFPIHNESGKVIAFGGRALAAGDEPKYLNSPGTPLYEKSRVLYNLHRAKESIRRQARSILVEGYMDVIGVYAAGFKEVVASCGTALTSLQVRMLRRHADQMVVNFDPDAAGANATEKSIQTLLEEQIQLKVLQLEGGLDPDEFIKTNGAPAYEAALSHARSYFHWLAERARQRFDFRSSEGRVQGFKFLLPAIQRMPDKLQRAAVAGDVASYLGVEPGMVLDEFRRAAAERREQRPLKPEATALHPSERMLLNAMLTIPDARRDILPALQHMQDWRRFRTARIFETLQRMEESSAPVDFAALDARLEEADRALLHEVALADEGNESHVTYEQAMECARSLVAAEKKAQVEQVRVRIKDAERAGNLEEALRLTAELRSLQRGT